MTPRGEDAAARAAYEQKICVSRHYEIKLRQDKKVESLSHVPLAQHKLTNNKMNVNNPDAKFYTI